MEMTQDSNYMILDLETIVTKYILKVKHLYKEYHHNLSVSIPKNKLPIQETFHKEILCIMKNFHSDRLELYKKVVFKKAELTILIKQRIDFIIIEEAKEG